MYKYIYLCGPITGCTYHGCTDWRNEVSRQFLPNIHGVSPLRAKEYLAAETDIADEYAEHMMSSAKAITTRDRFDTFRADMVLANFLGAERVSIGSCIEVGWADAKRVPLVAVMEPGSLHDHSMIREIAGWIVPTLDDAVFVINSVLGEVR